MARLWRTDRRAMHTPQHGERYGGGQDVRFPASGRRRRRDVTNNEMVWNVYDARVLELLARSGDGIRSTGPAEIHEESWLVG